MSTKLYMPNQLGTGIRHDKDSKRGIYTIVSNKTFRYMPIGVAPSYLGMTRLYFEQRDITFTTGDVQAYGEITAKQFGETARNLQLTFFRFGLTKTMTAYQKEVASQGIQFALNQFRAQVRNAHAEQIAHSINESLIAHIEAVLKDSPDAEYNVTEDAKEALGRDKCYVKKMDAGSLSFQITDQIKDMVDLIREKNIVRNNTTGLLHFVIGRELEEILKFRAKADEPSELDKLKRDLGDFKVFVLPKLGKKGFLFEPSTSVLGVILGQFAKQHPIVQHSLGSQEIGSTSTWSDMYVMQTGATGAILVKD